MCKAACRCLISELNVQSICDRLRSALDRVEILSFAPECDDQVVSLVGILCARQCLRNEDLGDLEKPAVKAAVLLVANHSVDHGCGQCSAHERQLLTDRVHHADRLALRRVLGIAQKVKIGG